MDLVSTDEAARRLGVSRRRVVAMIHAGQLPAERVGLMWLVRAKDLDAVRDRRPGRPSKSAASARKQK